MKAKFILWILEKRGLRWGDRVEKPFDRFLLKLI